MYRQVIEEQKVLGQLSSDRNDTAIASAMEQGFRSAGSKDALTKGVQTMKAQRKTGYFTAYQIAIMYAELETKIRPFGGSTPPTRSATGC